MTDLRRHGNDARREPPTLELGPTGPWGARVKVVPITGAGLQELRRRGMLRSRFIPGRHSERAIFEVVASWTGPPLPGLPPSKVPVSVVDTYDVEDAELARGIALAAAELLASGQEIPFLREIGAAIHAAGPGWRRAYEQLVGDAGRAAAAR